MKILLLGGTQDALYIAKRLLENQHQVEYSIAGLVGSPTLDCAVRVGGFGGASGLAKYLSQSDFDCLVDATHPYAENISEHAVTASELCQVPLVRYTRPAWQSQPGDNWTPVSGDWQSIVNAINRYRRPFFTIGRQPLYHTDDALPSQHWLIRTLAANDTGKHNVRVLRSRGPFDCNTERALMSLTGVDVLISKNSGGPSVAAKIDAARELRIPVIMLRRPVITAVEKDYADPDTLVATLPT